MGDDGRMTANFVYDLPGYSSEEIYRALIDWLHINQSIVFSGGVNFTSEENKIVVGSLFTQEFFVLDLITIASAVNGVTNSYEIRYDVLMRAKDGKVKITLKNVEAFSTSSNVSKPLIELYKKRGNKDGKPTVNYTAIKKIKTLLTQQMTEIESHASYVRANDTYQGRIIKASH